LADRNFRRDGGFLAVIGLYGVLSQTVLQRRREIASAWRWEQNLAMSSRIFCGTAWSSSQWVFAWEC